MAPDATTRTTRYAEHGQAGLLVILSTVMVMVTVPVAFEVMAVDQAPLSTQSVYAQAATSAAWAGVEDYVNHVENASTPAEYQAGTAYVERYCSSNYFPEPTTCGLDANNPALVNDTSGKYITAPATDTAATWVEPTSPSSYGGQFVEGYNYVVDVPNYFRPDTPGTYDITVYATGRAGADNPVGPRWVYRRAKATIEVDVAAPTPPTTQAPTSEVATCSGTPPAASTSGSISVPPWAAWAVVTLAGGAGGPGSATSLDTTVPSGGAGAALTAAVAVTGGSYVQLVAGCAGVGNGTTTYGGGGYASGGSGSSCDTTECGSLWGGGNGGGAGGASTLLTCTSATCASTSPYVIAGGGGGGGGDAAISGGDGGAGGSAAIAPCTNPAGCLPASIGGVTTGGGSELSGNS
ncbi:MAG: hypothetical protein ACYDD6_11150, partial [Acidimicrobiales bacterium]